MKNSAKLYLRISIVLFWFAQYVYIPYQTPYLTAMKLSSDFVGVVVGAYGISQMLLRLPVGVMADSANRHKVLIILGALSSGLASVFRIVLDSGVGFLVANIFSGLASAMWISFMVLFMSMFGENEQQKATAEIFVANNLGMLLGFVTSTLLYELLGMRIICALSVAGGLLSALIATKLPKGEKMGNPPPVKELLKICTEKNLVVFSLFAVVQQGVQMSTTMSFTNQVIKDMGGSSASVGISSIIYMCSAVVCSKLASGSLLVKIGPSKCIPATFLTTALYCVFVPMCTEIWQLCLLQLLPGLSSGVLLSNLTSEAMKFVPREKKSTAMGFYQAVYALGMTFFPIICGKIVNISSMRYAYFVLAAILVISSILSAFYYTCRQKRG
ncbi:MAG: MFS transporter [Clostridia bacterium]|nr:MFS transporter [Clostridia bacterium]